MRAGTINIDMLRIALIAGAVIGALTGGTGYIADSLRLLLILLHVYTLLNKLRYIPQPYYALTRRDYLTSKIYHPRSENALCHI